MSGSGKEAELASMFLDDIDLDDLLEGEEPPAKPLPPPAPVLLAQRDWNDPDTRRSKRAAVPNRWRSNLPGEDDWETLKPHQLRDFGGRGGSGCGGPGFDSRGAFDYHNGAQHTTPSDPPGWPPDTPAAVSRYVREQPSLQVRLVSAATNEELPSSECPWLLGLFDFLQADLNQFYIHPEWLAQQPPQLAAFLQAKGLAQPSGNDHSLLLEDWGADLEERVPLIRLKTGEPLASGPSPKLRDLMTTLQQSPGEYLPREDYARSRPRLMERLRVSGCIPSMTVCEQAWKWAAIVKSDWDPDARGAAAAADPARPSAARFSEDDDDPMVRVALVREDGFQIVGNAAPLFRNVAKYLERNPGVVVRDSWVVEHPRLARRLLQLPGAGERIRRDMDPQVLQALLTDGQLVPPPKPRGPGRDKTEPFDPARPGDMRLTLVHKDSGQKLTGNARPKLTSVRSDMRAYDRYALCGSWLAKNAAQRAFLEREGLVRDLGVLDAARRTSRSNGAAPRRGPAADQGRVPAPDAVIAIESASGAAVHAVPPRFRDIAQFLHAHSGQFRIKQSVLDAFPGIEPYLRGRHLRLEPTGATRDGAVLFAYCSQRAPSDDEGGALSLDSRSRAEDSVSPRSRSALGDIGGALGAARGLGAAASGGRVLDDEDLGSGRAYEGASARLNSRGGRPSDAVGASERGEVGVEGNERDGPAARGAGGARERGGGRGGSGGGDGDGAHPAAVAPSQAGAKPGKGWCCCFCGEGPDHDALWGSGELKQLGTGLEDGQGRELWYHEACAAYSSGIGELPGLQVPPKRIRTESHRGALISCSFCRRRGATLGCVNKRCKRSFHFTCARRACVTGRIFFSHSTRNISCWEHPQSVTDPEAPFTGLWMELCGGWNYVHQDELPDLTDEQRDAVINNPHLRQAIPPGELKVDAEDAAEVLMALNSNAAAAGRTASAAGAGVHRSPAASDGHALPGAPRSAEGREQRPHKRAHPRGPPGIDHPSPKLKLRRSESRTHVGDGPAEKPAPEPPVQRAPPPLPGTDEALGRVLDTGAADDDADGAPPGPPPLPPLECSVEERGYIAYALRGTALPVLSEATATARCERLLAWMRSHLATLHAALSGAVLDAHVVRFGTSVFIEHWRPHPELVGAARAALAATYSLPLDAAGDGGRLPPGVWVLLPELIGMLVAHVLRGQDAAAFDDAVPRGLPPVFPSAHAAKTWRILRAALASIGRLAPEERSPRLSVAAAKLEGALARVQGFGRGECVAFVGDRAAGTSLLINALLQITAHDAGYTCPHAARAPARLYHEALAAVTDELSFSHVGVTVDEAASRPDVDLVSMPAQYVALHQLRASVQQAQLHAALEDFGVHGSPDALPPFLLPLRQRGGAAEPAVKISVSHAHFPHVLVTYRSRAALQESAHVYLQKMDAEVAAGRLPRHEHFRPAAADDDAAEAKHAYLMLCGERLQLDADARPVASPSALALLPEVEAVAGARRVFHGLGLDLHLDLAWARDVLRLLLGRAGPEAAALCACLRDDDDALGADEARWRRQAAAVRDVQVFVPSTLLSNGARFVEAPATDCAAPRAARSVRDCLAEASTVLWLLGDEALSPHSAAAHHVSDFLRSLLPPRAAAAAAAAAPPGSPEPPAALPQLMFPPRRRLVALHWRDVAAHELPTVTGGVQSCRVTAARMAAFRDLLQRRDDALVAATQQQLQVLLEDVAASSSTWQDLMARQSRSGEAPPAERPAGDAAAASARAAALRDAGARLHVMAAYPLLGASMTASQQLLSRRNGGSAAAAQRYDAAVAATNLDALLQVLNFSNETRLQALISAMLTELAACVAGEQTSMLDSHIAPMLRGQALAFPRAPAAGDPALERSLLPLECRLHAGLSSFRQAAQTGAAPAAARPPSVLDELNEHILDCGREAGRVCAAWFALSKDASQPRIVHRDKGGATSLVRRWLVSPSLAGGHRALCLQDLTLFYLSADDFVSLLTRRLDGVVASAASDLLDALKDAIAEQVKAAFSGAQAEAKLEEAMGRKAQELVEQLRPDVTALIRTYLLGAAGDGLLCWPSSSRTPAAAPGPAVPEAAAAPSPSTSSATLKLMIVRTVRDMWRTFLANHLESSAGNVSWLELVNLAWLVMESSAVSICQHAQMRVLHATGALHAATAGEADAADESAPSARGGGERLAVLRDLFHSVLGHCKRMASSAAASASPLSQRQDAVAEALRGHVSQLEVMQTLLLQLTPADAASRHSLAASQPAAAPSPPPPSKQPDPNAAAAAQAPSPQLPLTHELLASWDVLSDGADGGGWAPPRRVERWVSAVERRVLDPSACMPPLQLPADARIASLARAVSSAVDLACAPQPPPGDTTAAAAALAAADVRAMLPRDVKAVEAHALPPAPDALLLALCLAVSGERATPADVARLKSRVIARLAEWYQQSRLQGAAPEAAERDAIVAALRGDAAPAQLPQVSFQAAWAAAHSSDGPDAAFRRHLRRLDERTAASDELCLFAAASVLRANVVVWRARVVGRPAVECDLYRELRPGGAADMLRDDRALSAEDRTNPTYHVLEYPGGGADVKCYAAVVPLLEGGSRPEAPVATSPDMRVAGVPALQDTPELWGTPANGTAAPGAPAATSALAAPSTVFDSASPGGPDLWSSPVDGLDGAAPPPPAAPRMLQHQRKLGSLELDAGVRSFPCLTSPRRRGASAPGVTSHLARLASISGRILAMDGNTYEAWAQTPAARIESQALSDPFLESSLTPVMPGCGAADSVILVIGALEQHPAALLGELLAALREAKANAGVAVGLPLAALAALQAALAADGAPDARRVAAGRLLLWAETERCCVTQSVSQHLEAKSHMTDLELEGPLGAYAMAQQIMSSALERRPRKAVVVVPQGCTQGAAALAASGAVLALHQPVCVAALTPALISRLLMASHATVAALLEGVALP